MCGPADTTHGGIRTCFCYRYACKKAQVRRQEGHRPAVGTRTSWSASYLAVVMSEPRIPGGIPHSIGGNRDVNKLWELPV